MEFGELWDKTMEVMDGPNAEEFMGLVAERLPGIPALVDPAPEKSEKVAATFACPCCGERRMDWLAWNSDGTIVTCATCNADYDPCEV